MRVALVLTILALLPTSVRVGAGQSSMAAGLLAAALLTSVLLVGRATTAALPRSWILAFLACAPILLAPALLGEADTFKVIVSVFIAAYLMGFAGLLATAVREVSYAELAKGLRIIAVMLMIIGWAGAIYILRNPNIRARPVYPFNEPSHYALVAGPVYLAVLVMNRKWRPYILLTAATQAVLFPSTVLAVYVVLMLAITTRGGYALLVAFGLLGAGIWVLAILQPSTVDYFAARVLIGGAATGSSTASLSTLVFLQGVMDAYRGLAETHGLGWGFQMLGTQPPNIFAERIHQLAGVYLNSTDGGAGLAGKLMSELGVVGLVISIVILARTLKSMHVLRGVARRPDVAMTSAQRKALLAHAFVAAFIVELLLRNLGYFSPGVVLFMVALLQTRDASPIAAANVPGRGHARPVQL